MCYLAKCDRSVYLIDAVDLEWKVLVTMALISGIDVSMAAFEPQEDY